MEAENKSFFVCTKSDCIRLYNEYLKLVTEINQDIELLHDKAKRLQQGAGRLTSAHPTDMVKTAAWANLKKAIKHTSNATKQVTQSIAIAKQAVNTADSTAREIEKAVTCTSQDLLICGKCKMKREHTSDNIDLHFKCKKDGSRFANCIKCRFKNQAARNYIARVTDPIHTAETTTQEPEQSPSPTTQPLLVCGKCKSKKKHTSNNISQYFGYKNNGCIFSNCIKCRVNNKQYKLKSGERVTAEAEIMGAEAKIMGSDIMDDTPEADIVDDTTDDDDNNQAWYES
jgi:hypothetical protein